MLEFVADDSSDQNQLSFLFDDKIINNRIIYRSPSIVIDMLGLLVIYYIESSFC